MFCVEKRLSGQRERERQNRARAGDHGKGGESEAFPASFHLPRDLHALTILFPSPPIYLLLSLALNRPPFKNPREPLGRRELLAIKCVGTMAYNRVRTSSEIQKSRVFQGYCSVFFQGFSRVLEARNENNNVHNELFKTAFKS